MAYVLKVYRLGNFNEYEFGFTGKYGRKGEKRTPKKKPTPEQMKKVNQRRRENELRRVIILNFSPHDIWVTLKYPAGMKKTMGQVLKDFELFRERLRREYKKRKCELKYVYRVEVGKNGGVHIHFLVNRIRGNPETDELIQQLWTHGRANFTSLHESGGYKDLAAYIVKKPDEEIEGQLSLFPAEERKAAVRYNTSRNLIRPVPERKEYSHRTVRLLLMEGPKPTHGFYIDKASIVSGINPYTGTSYYKYTEVRIRPSPEEAKVKQVNIYTMSSAKSPKAADGKGIYILEVMGSKGEPRTLTGRMDIEKSTANQAELKVLIEALKRMREPAELTIYTESAYVASGWDNLEEWKKNGWKTTRGTEAKNRELWEELAELLKNHAAEIKLQEKHSYKKWMEGEVVKNV